MSRRPRYDPDIGGTGRVLRGDLAYQHRSDPPMETGGKPPRLGWLLIVAAPVLGIIAGLLFGWWWS